MGIPYSDVGLNAIDYSIVSPALTVWSATFIIWGVAYVFSAVQIIPESRASRIILGILILLVSVGAIVLELAFLEGIPGLSEPLDSLLPLPVILADIGVRILISGISMEEERLVKLLLRRLKPYGLLGIILAILICGLLIVNQAGKFGQYDAKEMLKEEALAKISFVESSSVYRNLCSPIACDCEIEGYSFIVILASDKFLYVRQPCSEGSSDNPLIHAIPIQDIHVITYRSKQAP